MNTTNYFFSSNTCAQPKNKVYRNVSYHVSKFFVALKATLTHNRNYSRQTNPSKVVLVQFQKRHFHRIKSQGNLVGKGSPVVGHKN